MCAVISAAARVASLPALVGNSDVSHRGFQLVRGGPGDHGPVYQLLNAVFASPTRESYSASLDDPFYEPNDRILVRRGLQVLSHAQVTQQAIHFGAQSLPVAGLHAVATLPEFRRQGFATAVVRLAEERMRADGAEAALLNTSEPHFFRALGWVVCGRHSLARGHARPILAELSSRGVPAAADMPHIRPLRQVELPSVMKVYNAAIAGRYGALERTEAYWRWLASRGGFDQIFVAMGGNDLRAWDAFDSPVVGYVVLKENQILELMTLPSLGSRNCPAGLTRCQAAEQLLARACHEAIERDLHAVQFHAPPDDPLFELFRIAGGELHHREQFAGEVQMVKLFDPARFLARIGPELQRRLAAAGRKQAELGFSLDGEKRLLTVSRRGVRFKRANLGRNYLRLNQAEFVRLLLGHDALPATTAHGRIYASTRLASDTAQVLFPPLALWRSPWDELYL